jgi:non-homologous end joining protein Ku
LIPTSSAIATRRHCEALINKNAGQPVTLVKPANDDTKVIDLMAALKKSLGAARSGAGGQRQKAGRRAA